MARVYSKLTPSTYAEQLWNFIQALVSAGGSIVSSGDGLSALSTTTSVFSGGAASGANGFDNSGAWAQVAMPSRDSITWHVVMQHDAIGGARVKLSKTKMTGSPLATRTPTGGTIVLGTGTDASPTYGAFSSWLAVEQIVWYDTANPYDVASFCYPTGGGDVSQAAFFDPIATLESGQTQTVFYIASSIVWTNLANDDGLGTSAAWAEVKKGQTGAAIANVRMLAAVRPGEGVTSAAAGTPRHTFRIFYARSGAASNPQQVFGYSTVFRALSVEVGTPHTGTVSTTRDRLILGPLVTSWDGSTV